MEGLTETYLVTTPLLLVLLAIATCDDLLERRIPNVVVVWGIVLALGIGGMSAGHAGFLTSLGGLLLGGLLLLPFYLLGGMGAGDVKLMAMSGAFLGPAATLLAVLVTLAAGFVLALSVLAIWLVGRSAPGLAILSTFRRVMPQRWRPGYPGPRPGRFPYAAAIATGSMFALFWPVANAAPALGF